MTRPWRPTILFLLAILGGCVTSQKAPFGPAPTEVTATAPAMGELLDQYATAAGGWYLDRRCEVLNADDRRIFDWNVEQATIHLAKTMPQKALEAMQASAKTVADKYDCGDRARGIVQSTLTMSGETAFALTGKRFSVERQLESDSKRLTALLLSQRIDDRCHAMPPPIRKEYDGLLGEITGRFEQRAGAESLARLRTDATARPLPATICENNVSIRLRMAVDEARAMAKGL